MKEIPLTPRDALLYLTTLIINFLKIQTYFSCKSELKKTEDLELINNFEDLA